MRIDRAGMPFVAAALVPAGILSLTKRPWWALPLAVAGGFFLYFFRDPERVTPPDPDAVVAPADGRVLVAGEPEPKTAPPGVWQQISIFLSPLDVHVNRVPVSGRITRVDYHPGKFLPAYRREAATDNERNEIWIDHGGRPIVCRQVVGFLARRIVCRTAPGAQVEAGERFGLMKFGSRMDVYVPPDARLSARVGDHVRGGETILARL